MEPGCGIAGGRRANGRIAMSEKETIATAAINLNRQLEIVTQQIIRARIYFDLWWFYKSANTRPKIIDTMDEFSDFFRFDEHAQFVSMIIHCGAVWDRTKGSVGLMSLASRILDQKRCPSDKALFDEITNYQSEAAGLVTIRKEAIAHRSAKFDYSKAFERAQLIPSAVPAAMDSWLAVANILRTRIGLPKEYFSTQPLNHVRAMIHKLGGPNLLPPSPLDDFFNS